MGADIFVQVWTCQYTWRVFYLQAQRSEGVTLHMPSPYITALCYGVWWKQDMRKGPKQFQVKLKPPLQTDPISTSYKIII